MRTDIKFTYQEYRTLPETGPRYQLIEGDLLMSPAPNFFHQKLVVRLLRLLAAFVEGREAGEVCVAPLDVILTEEDVVQPDIVYVSNARKGIIAPEGLRGAPDLCVEVLSPASRDLDRQAKRVLYARHGVTELWLVDPDARTIELFRLQEQPHAPMRIFREDETLTTALLPGLEVKLADVFEG
jgi:Uma2 family endonuclease